MALLPLAIPERFLDFFFYGLQVEGRRGLHRRILDRRLGEFPHLFLHQDESPELAGIEVVHVAAAEIVHALAAG